MTAHVIPYCGTPPTPAELIGRWNLDPVLLAALAAVTAVYVLGSGRGGLPKSSRHWFYAGWGVTALALISPLCPLSVALFSARVGQHMILTLIAAPMVALGRPLDALVALLPHGPKAASDGAAATAPLAAGLFAVLLWYWHAPGPYAGTFDSTLTYWTMHLTVFGSALWLWTALIARLGARPAQALAAGLLSTVQMGLLGALITLAPRAVYAPHFATAGLWGLTPLQDQQLGGALMWAPGCLAFLAAAVAELWALLERAGPAASAAHAPAPEVAAP
jgi:putative membrane protein